MAWPLVCLLLLTCCSGSFSQPALTQAPSMSASLGATARLSCTVSSQYITYNIRWYQQSLGKAPRFLMNVKSDGSVEKGQGVHDRFSGSASGANRYLSISNLQAEDEADYYCGTGSEPNVQDLPKSSLRQVPEMEHLSPHDQHFPPFLSYFPGH